MSGFFLCKNYNHNFSECAGELRMTRVCVLLLNAFYHFNAFAVKSWSVRQSGEMNHCPYGGQ